MKIKMQELLLGVMFTLLIIRLLPFFPYVHISLHPFGSHLVREWEMEHE